ncbi:MAG: hypothetical protein ABFS21_02890 [Actinomycetota bacterium]
MKRIVWLAGFVVALLLVEGFIVGAVVISPSARESISGASVRVGQAWAGDGETPGFAERVSTSAGDVYDEWIVPLWSVGEVTKGEAAFSKCITCHTDYADRRLFDDVYMNHPVHDAAGLSCDACHTDVAHPKPLPPEEEVCAGCHDEVNESGECRLCHSPGSLPHFYMLDLPRTGYVDCAICHLEDSFTPINDHHLSGAMGFDGSDLDECTACHSETACQQCHADEHPDDWLDIHGRGVAYQGQGKCQVCHTGSTCTACHASTSINPFQKKPLPTGG